MQENPFGPSFNYNFHVALHFSEIVTCAFTPIAIEQMISIPKPLLAMESLVNYLDLKWAC